jgi:nucleoside-diphosphate-sugar epimerase
MTLSSTSSLKSNLHVVIGSGTLGERLAKLMAKEAKQVLVVTRSNVSQRIPGVNYVIASASSTQSLIDAIPRADVIYNCVNPPYQEWKAEWPKISNAINKFAMMTDADLVNCSNLYGYGPYDGVLTEDLPQRATWTNGQVRAEMWQQAKELFDQGKLRVTEVRGSDYLCANEQSRMGHRVIPKLLLKKPVQLLGALDEPHTWTDPDDVAKLMMVLGADDRGWGRPWHVPSNEPKTQREVVADIANQLNVTDYQVKAVGAVIERALGILNPLIRELNKGNYQFNKPFVMSSTQAIESFRLSPKPWNKTIEDLILPYLEYIAKNGLDSINKLGNKRL